MPDVRTLALDIAGIKAPGYSVIINIISGTAALGSIHATLKSGTKTAVDCVVTVANTGTNAVGTFAVDVIGIRT